MKKNWNTTLPNKTSNHINEWADYVEICCLVSNDIVSRDDILDIMNDSNIVELDDDLNDRNCCFDKYSELVGDAYAIIKYRAKWLGEYYPFHLGLYCLELKEGYDIYNSVYVFLLLASSTRQVSSFHCYAKTFEKMCGIITRGLSFTKADNMIVGTAGELGKGSVYGKIQHIAELVNSVTTLSVQKTKRLQSPSGGDGGVDIISVRPFSDGYGFRPIIMGQCTISREQWENKQRSISHDIWSRWICDLPMYIEIMWIPFSICGADGLPENPSCIRTCIMDRYRIMEIVKENESLLVGFDYSNVIRRELEEV